MSGTMNTERAIPQNAAKGIYIQKLPEEACPRTPSPRQVAFGERIG